MELEEKLKNLPALPGVYLMTDADGNIIYVGKARYLKNRVRQYFHASSNRDEKVSAMVKRVFDFRYIVTNNEVEAFILESNLIKKYKPQYNILLKDDKAYPFIKINLNDKFPKIEIARSVKNDGAKYFGPYMAGISAKNMTELIEGAFPLRNCKIRFEKKKRNHRPCLNYHIKRCLAPCCLEVGEEYKRILGDVLNFLSGNDKEIQKVLAERMIAAGENEDFETAIYYRDKLKLLDKVVRKQVAVLKKDFNLDVFGITGNGMFSVVSLIVVRGGKIVGEENFMSSDASLSRAETLCSFIGQYYSARSINVGEIIVSELPDGKDAVEEMLNGKITNNARMNAMRTDTEAIEISNGGISDDMTADETDSAVGDCADYSAAKRRKYIKITCPKQGVRKQLVDTVVKNAAEYMRVNELRAERKKDMTFGAAEMLKNLLGLKRFPHRIEAYDISNISGQYKVSSMVVFTDGAADNSQYRRFKIKAVEGADDFKSMNETLARRLGRLLDGSENKDSSFGKKPDLIVIDGGKGQLSSAHAALSESGVEGVEMISLAKREEEIYTLYSDFPIALGKTNLSLNMLMRLRDEAHRFAITYFRKLKASREFESRLTEIEGIGKAKAANLFKHFKTLEKIKNADMARLLECRGIGKKDAENVMKFFGKNSE
jgi:excinuclease ABC subunit C